MIVVSDTGPIGHLIQIDRIDLLPRLFVKVLLPPAVLQELRHESTPPEIGKWLEAIPEWLELRASEAQIEFRRSGAGEREAIQLAKELDAPLLCDDRRAVKQARREGLSVTGTLGILQQADANGWLNIDEEVQKLQRLMKMRMSEHLIRSLVRNADGRLGPNE